jgi:hypothetical protein
MQRAIELLHVEPVVQALLGSIDIGDGGTHEQRGVITAFVHGYWGRDDLDIEGLTPLEPDQAAAAITDAAARRRLRELMVVLELSRHPLTDAQATRTEAYAAAIHEHGPGLELARELVRFGAEFALADYMRRTENVYGDLSEPTLQAKYGHDIEEPDPELSGRLRAMQDLPEGTLGHEYFAFLDRHGFEFPGETTTAPAVFVRHDMCHVISGYETSGEEEIGVNAMQLALDETDANWLQFLGSMSIHEAGFFSANGFIPKTGTLERDGAAAILAEAFRRGVECTGDYPSADHFALADQPLENVREQFGIPPRQVYAP